MTILFRILLVVAAVIVLIFISMKVRDSKVRLEDSLFWFFFAIAVLIMSIFPQIFDFLAYVTGVKSTTNFVFLFFIFVLLIKCFTMSMRISQLDTKAKELAQELALNTERNRASRAERAKEADAEQTQAEKATAEQTNQTE